MARARTRIGPDGSVINDDDDDHNNDNDNDGSGGGCGGSGNAGGVGGRGGGTTGRGISLPGRWCCRLPRRIDTFGFDLESRHFAMVLLFVSVTAGRVGLAFFVFSLMAYAYCQRRSSSSSSTGGGGGGWGGGRWKDGRAVGSNIRGVGDLPKPKGG
ncbi:hypothetical protein ACHAXA_005167 [Cyclostephanos tholiformis]|uniref:Uncharacterized protein n=1 Tax=Cyclostephanos tholiformis TaxID=382380 RepID=A0ABD3R7I6_9STRA